LMVVTLRAQRSQRESFTAKMRSRHNPSGTKAKQLCLDDSSGPRSYESRSEKVKHHAEHRAQNETFALVPSFLQDHASIDAAPRDLPT
jgi:hypothetical protein